MNSPVARIIGLAALCLSLVAAGSQRINIEIFVVANAHPHPYIEQATITVTYAGGTQTLGVEGPNPHARFILPAVQSADVRVVAAGYCTLDTTITFDRSSYVGGHAFWLGLDSCGPAASPASH